MINKTNDFISSLTNNTAGLNKGDKITFF